MITHLGSKTLGALNPMLATLTTTALSDYLNSLHVRFNELTAMSQHYVKLATLPDPATMAAQLSAALASIGSQLATLALGAIPTIGIAQADFVVQLGLIGVQLAAVTAVMADLVAALSAGGVHAFSVDSTAATVGPELTALVSGGMPGGGLPNARVRGVLLLTEDPAAFTALSKLLLIA